MFWFCWLPGIAAGADSTSFDPTPVAIKAIGGGVPVGTVVAWPVASNPEDYENWLECNGQSTAGYPDLAAIVGATVPNYKGMFLRGYGSQNHSKNNGSTVGVTGTTHSSGDLGAIQGDAIRNIVGSLDTGALERNQFVDVAVVSGAIKTRRGIKQYTQDPPYEGNLRPSGFDFDSSLVVPDANENRPVNTAVRYLIRAKP